MFKMIYYICINKINKIIQYNVYKVTFENTDKLK